MYTFYEYSLNQQLIDALDEQRIKHPTDIQHKSIPHLLQGKDVIAQAQTGTGKTLAYTLPIIQQLDESSQAVQALIVAPTRELALQITEEIKALTSHLDADVLALYGGQQVDQQLKRLEGNTPIVVGTPGRLIDHLNRGTIRLGSLRHLVIDEADQMFEIGFLNDIEDIISRTPGNRQMVLCSATMPQPIRKLARTYMKDPVTVTSEAETVTVKEIKQIAVETTHRARKDTLVTLIHQFQPYLAIVFCRTKRRARQLNGELLEAGVLSDELHGDLSQAKRERVMKQFREAKIQVLVATDVAARGIDVEGITHVFNYDLPPDTEQYIHRIGRTGRAGASGLAVSLVTPRDADDVRRIERGIKMPLRRQTVKDGRLVTDSQTPEKQTGSKTADTGQHSKKSTHQRGKGTYAGKRDVPAKKERNDGKPGPRSGQGGVGKSKSGPRTGQGGAGKAKSFGRGGTGNSKSFGQGAPKRPNHSQSRRGGRSR
ncbi:DEAD/DEAH box helicase [Aureibacillus halotolerans]|uniref:RNA helicase n=1 Tax=Aureibacillus halotolerans TaxID=1508390 RepID=A0A4R6U8E4_9BACI|nr:DEAD/DEAH box helicase [Aureibacillus halotolerans]TDQ42828.1 ATP-dependent RNA helicase DeaD [Aureibacillus halotolerans]